MSRGSTCQDWATIDINKPLQFTVVQKAMFTFGSWRWLSSYLTRSEGGRRPTERSVLNFFLTFLIERMYFGTTVLKKSSNVTWNLKSMGMRINFGYRSNSARWRWLYYRIQWQKDDNRTRMCLHSAHLNQLMLITKNRGSRYNLLIFWLDTRPRKKRFHFDCMCSIFAEFLCANSHESLSVRRSNWVTTDGNRLLKMGLEDE